MEQAAESKKDLTTTIHLTSLRSVDSSTEKLLEQAGSELATILSQLASENAMLVSLIGPNRGERFLLDQNETSIGRAPESDIFLDDVTVSRKHASISRTNGNFIITDLGSLNGTYVNGSVVSSINLNDADEIQIGKFRMHFFSGKVKR